MNNQTHPVEHVIVIAHNGTESPFPVCDTDTCSEPIVEAHAKSAKTIGQLSRQSVNVACHTCGASL